MTRLVFLDTETTGLDPDVHEVWEVAAIVRDTAIDRRVGDAPEAHDVERVWQLQVDLGRADPVALNIGRYHDRAMQPATPAGEQRHAALAGIDAERAVPTELLPEWCAWFATVTWGAHLVGAVPSFDEERLRRLLRANGACPGWHYHLVDVEAVAVGYSVGFVRGVATAGDIVPYSAAVDRAKRAGPPWDSDDVAAGVGVRIDEEDRHTALGDARWARAVYDATIGKRPT